MHSTDHIPQTTKKDSRPVCRWPLGASPEGERKVRAAQGIPLPNRKRSARVCRCRRKEPPRFAWGKGEKVE